jgi:hypothetical protein
MTPTIGKASCDIRRPRCAAAIAMWALLLVGGGSVFGEAFPRVSVGTLAGGAHLELPTAIAGHDSLLIVGFSDAASAATGEWGSKLSKELAGYRNLQIYPVADLQGVPGPFLGIVETAIRIGVPHDLWGRFFVIRSDDVKWKDAVAWREPDLAYLLLIGPDGGMMWKWAGKYSPAGVASLKRALDGTD